MFQNLVIPQYNISSNIWNFEYFLNRLSPTHSLIKMVLVCRSFIKTFQVRVSEPGHATVKYFIKILKFWLFLKQTMSLIFVSWNYSCVLTWYKNTQICVPESSHVTVNISLKLWNSKVFLKLCCPILSFLKPCFLFLSLVIKQWNTFYSGYKTVK